MSDQVTAKKEKVNVTIDGNSFSVDAGKTVLEVANGNGIYIPTICWLKKLTPIGSCRICIVEVEGSESPMTSCQLPVSEGMVVTTNSERIAEERKLMVRMMLVNHPIDCPVCERSGECRLQDSTFEFGISRPDITAEPVKREKIWKEWGLVRYDPNLCILCERCVRACREIQGFDAFRIVGKGYSSTIGTKDGKPLDCDYCGQCIDVCPVGALNTSLLLGGRSWDFDNVNSICGYCGVGCTLRLDVKAGQVMRVKTVDDMGNNNGSLCALGYFGFQFSDHKDRLKTPLIKKGDKFEAVSWEDALKTVSDKLNEIKGKDGGDALACIGSGRLLNEDNYLLQKLCRTVLGSNNIDNLVNINNKEFGGDLFNSFESNPIQSTDVIYNSDLIFSIGADLGEENPVIGNMVRSAMRDNLASLLIAHNRNVKFMPHPNRQLLYRYGSEVHLINGIAKCIIETKGISNVDSSANFDKYANNLKQLDLETVAAKAGVTVDQIKDSASIVMSGNSPVILCGRDIYNHPRGVEIFQSVQNLAKIIGGKAILYREECNSQGVNDMGLIPDYLPGYQKQSGSSQKDLLEIAGEGNIKGMIVMGEDILSRYPDGSKAREALNNTEFLIAMDIFPTETALCADVILPIAGPYEVNGTMTNMEGRVQRINKGVDTSGDSKPAWEVIRDIGNRLGGQFDYKSSGDVLKEIRESVSLYGCVDEEKLNNGGCLLSYKNEETPFNFEVIEAGEPYVSENDNEFILNSGNGFFHFPPFSEKSERLGGMTSDYFAEINPADAEKNGINDKDRIEVSCNGSSIEAKAKITEKSAEGSVFIPRIFKDKSVNIFYKGKDDVPSVSIRKLN